MTLPLGCLNAARTYVEYVCTLRVQYICVYGMCARLRVSVLLRPPLWTTTRAGLSAPSAVDRDRAQATGFNVVAEGRDPATCPTLTSFVSNSYGHRTPYNQPNKQPNDHVKLRTRLNSQQALVER